MMDIPKNKMVSLRLNEKLISRAKKKADEEKRSFTKFVENLIEKYLNGELKENPGN